MLYCAECHTSATRGQRYCGKCGKKLAWRLSGTNRKIEVIGIILASLSAFLIFSDVLLWAIQGILPLAGVVLTLPLVCIIIVIFKKRKVVNLLAILAFIITLALVIQHFHYSTFFHDFSYSQRALLKYILYISYFAGSFALIISTLLELHKDSVPVRNSK